MKEFKLEAKVRKETKTKSSRRSLRREGLVPGVFYSKVHEPISIAVQETQINRLVFTSAQHLVDLAIEEKGTYKCFIKDFQIDPVTDRVVHYDMLGFTDDQMLEVEIPLALIGNAPGVKEGGVLNHLLHKLHIKCLPKDLQEHIEINIGSMKIGDTVHCSDIKVEGIEILNPANALVVTISSPKAEKEVAAEGTKEPEVIIKGKKTEE